MGCLCIENLRAAHNFLMKKVMGMETGTKIVKLSAVTAAVYLGMKFIFPIVLPFLIALILAGLLYPLAKMMERKAGFRKETSRLAAYGIFLLGIGLIAAGLLYFCYCMGSKCIDNMDYFMESADSIFCSCCDKLEEISGIRTEEIQKTMQSEMSSFTESAVEYSKDAGWYMMGLLAKIFVTFIAVFLVLNDYEKITGGIKKTQAGKYAVRMFEGIKTASGAYLKAQLCIMGIITAVCIAGLFLLRIPYAFWIGLAIGICDALPILGTGTVLVPWALIELLLGGYINAAGLFIIYIICSFIRQILEPRMVGKSLGVSPLAVLISIYIGIYVYGGAGVLLGPISALVIYEVYKTF